MTFRVLVAFDVSAPTREDAHALVTRLVLASPERGGDDYRITALGIVPPAKPSRPEAVKP